MTRSKFSSAARWLLCLLLWSGGSRVCGADVVPSFFLRAYQRIDAAAARRDINGYMDYDAPNFVTGNRGQMGRVRAKQTLGLQMKQALQWKSKTDIEQIVFQKQTAQVKTHLSQIALYSSAVPGSQTVKFVYDLQNVDTWRKQDGRWQRVSSITKAGTITNNGRLMIKLGADHSQFSGKKAKY